MTRVCAARIFLSMRYSLTVDLIGSTTNVTVEADSTEQATAYVAAMYPEARSVSLTGLVPA